MKKYSALIIITTFLLFAFQKPPSILGSYSQFTCNMTSARAYDLYLLPSNKYIYTVKQSLKDDIEIHGSWEVRADTLFLKHLLTFKYNRQPIHERSINAIDFSSYPSVSDKHIDSLKAFSPNDKILVNVNQSTSRYLILEDELKPIDHQRFSVVLNKEK